MEIFNKIKMHATILGLQDFKNPKSRLICLTLQLIALFIHFIEVLITTWYVVCNETSFLEKTKCLALVNMIAYCGSNCCILLWHWEQLERNIETIKKLIREREAATTHNLYRLTIEDIELVSSRGIQIGYGLMAPFYILPAMIKSYFLYFRTLSTESFQLPIEASFPFDWRAPISYGLACLILAIGIFSNFSVYLMEKSIFYGYCKMLTAFSIDLKNSFLSLGNEFEQFHKIIGSSHVRIVKNIRIKEMLSKIIQFHCDLAHLARDCSLVYNAFLLAFFNSGMLSWAIILFQLNICMTEYNSDLFVVSITEVFTVMPFLLLMCHFGENVTIAFEKVDETACYIQWYLAPLELQRHFVMIQAMAQRPIHFQSVLSHTCSHESFKSIVNTGYSFFMILCRLD